MGQLLIYKASAGSGKTFTLAIEYIKHLIQNPRAYRRILAVTFTNKATAEMKERILSQLYGISTGDAGSEIYLDRVQEDTGFPKEEIRKRAGEALTNMIHDYSRFRVETIDSFFQSVMRNLARELELSPNLNVELNNEEVLSEAVDSMIEKLTPTSPTLAWLLDYINERIANDKRWNVSDEIKRFGRNIFDEGYIEKGSNLRQRLKDPNTIATYRKELESMIKISLEQMAEFADIFEEELEAYNLSPEDLKNGSRGIGSYFRKIKEGKLTNDIRNTTVEKCLDDPKNWATKTSQDYNTILSLASSTLIPLLKDSERARVKSNETVNSCRLSMQHLSKLQLLANIDDEVRELNKENNRFLLSDTNALLHRLIGDGDSSFIFEKIGTNIRNVMIDEFQDTSRMQWGNFKLLLLEGLSQGASSLIVGDVKQSIYRWRNGDWGILNSLNDTIGNFPIDARTLNTNRRSESNIINFNNELFTQAVDYLDSVHFDELGSSCESLIKAYQDVVQESPRTQAKGYVKVSFLEPDEEYDYTGQTLIGMGEEVTRLLESGVNQNDIAILVRKNKNIPRIADYFDKELKCKIVSDEAFRLDASLAICIMIDALRFLSDTTDSISLAQLTGKVPGPNFLVAPQSELLPERFVNEINNLRLMPLYELLEELFDIFQLEKIENQDAYLFAFFDAVLDYLQKHSSDLDSFIEFWDKTLCRKTIPGGEIEGIRIFSIHKSKGLEFHTVLIPFCDWKLENETYNQLVWCSPTKAPYDHIDIVPINYSSLMAESVYRDDYLHERLQLWVDNLNLLYVAFTRAGKNLIVWSKKGQKGTMSELLSNALPRVAQKAGMQWDEDEPFEQGELCSSKAEDEKTVTNKLLQKPEKLPVKMKSARHDIKFRQSNRSADFIRGIAEEDSYHRLIDRGSLLHTLFSAIQTEADIEPAIEQLIFEGIIGDKEMEEEVRAVTTKAFANPQIKEWYSGEWRLFNECAIIYKENGRTQLRRPDRVMMNNERVIIVDFKFGKEDKRYERQVQQYMNLLTRMGYQNIEGYLWYAGEGSEALHPVFLRTDFTNRPYSNRE
ncbi:exodeoxyribonuclease V subunit beta [Bacteroides sp. 51]|uniref:UvrD-helicase domain-containing protein n=1 Tax=Bacteroides sp. 51 TaxID=2302938 RepID=UPI0013D8C4B9|nr:UvrD-helicase domain-containing protein [Bacteroides sp. 51]NDV82738.1 ATP-dependent helicase [Bacteroides sp. 51]